MPRRRRHHHHAKGKKAGLPPGTLVFTGQKRLEVPDLTVCTYNAESIATSKSLTDIRDPAQDSVLWVDIRGLHETELVREIGSRFGIHPLALEDIVDIHQRPKYDSYDQGFLMLMESFAFLPEENRVMQEQVSVFCGENFVLTFQEDEKDIFESIRERINNTSGRIRRSQSDYLTYALMDTLVDRYFITLEAIGDHIEVLEEEISVNPNFGTKNRIHTMKRTVLEVRKGIAPLREALSRLTRSDSPFVRDTTRIYLQDLYGNVIQSIEMADNFRDLLSGMHDLYLTEISYKMNKVMQTLTIVATIFIPLTFIAGVYGMNFDNMPELHWRYGYFYLLGFMLVVALGLLYLFYRKKWLKKMSDE
jgi:magnesium transporter